MSRLKVRCATKRSDEGWMIRERGRAWRGRLVVTGGSGVGRFEGGKGR